MKLRKFNNDLTDTSKLTILERFECKPYSELLLGEANDGLTETMGLIIDRFTLAEEMENQYFSENVKGIARNEIGSMIYSHYGNYHRPRAVTFYEDVPGNGNLKHQASSSEFISWLCGSF